jgi:hypothetical protein
MSTAWTMPYTAVTRTVGRFARRTLAANTLSGRTMMKKSLVKWQALALAAALGGCGPVPGDDGLEILEGEVTSGSVYFLKAVSSGKCMDVSGASKSLGANIIQWDCNKQANQQFRFTSKTGGYEVVAMHSGLCLDVYGASNADGAKVNQWVCNGHTSQRWKLISKGSGQYQVQAQNSGKCLQVAGNSTTRGASIQQWTCAERSSQNFTFSTASSGGGSGGSTGAGGSTGSGGSTGGDLTWRKANLTWFTSYPDPGSEECIEFNGCMWAGQFAFLPNKQTENWVMMHNIAAVHEKDANAYKLKTLRLKQGTHQIDVTVYDMCSDSDCNGCCTANSRQTGFLIDIESFTRDRFGADDGVVDWACLDCK